MAGGGGPGAQHELGMQWLRSDEAPRPWNRRVWFYFALALMPLILFAIVGVLVAR